MEETAKIIKKVRGLYDHDLVWMAKRIKVSLSCLRKLRYGAVTDPRASTIDRLRAFFMGPQFEEMIAQRKLAPLARTMAARKEAATKRAATKARAARATPARRPARVTGVAKKPAAKRGRASAVR